MNYADHFAGIPVVEACVAGAGSFGISLIRQSARVPALSVRVVIERETGLARGALESAGVPSDRIEECREAEAARRAWDSGSSVAADDISTVIGLPFQILVESTGIPDIGAKHAVAAIEAGKHVGIATKETESVVGPYLTHAALDRGLIFTPLDGDQPALLIGLITWARTLGFEIISAGKSSEYDFVWDKATGAIIRNGAPHEAPAVGDAWQMGTDVRASVLQRRTAITDIPFASAPDLCEMTNVANATGLRPDIPELHSPALRTIEVPNVFDLTDRGGLLSGTGRIDVFNCLRKPDELSFAGGVFVVVRCDNEADWTLMAEKGHVLSRDRSSAMIYLPRHLLGLEAAISLLDAVGKRLTSGGGTATRPAIDLVGRAERAFSAGHRFTMEGHHREFDGVRPEMHPARPIDQGGAAPLYMLPNAMLGRDIEKGELIPFDALAEVPNPTLLRLRREQDQRFL